LFLLTQGPWPIQETEEGSGPISSEERHRWWGPPGEKEEGLKNYLWVVLGREEALGGGSSMERGGRRRTEPRRRRSGELGASGSCSWASRGRGEAICVLGLGSAWAEGRRHGELLLTGGNDVGRRRFGRAGAPLALL